MNYLKFSVFLLTFIILGSGCVSKKKLNEANAALETHRNLLSKCEERNKELEGQILDLTRKLEAANANLKKANDELASANMKLKLADDQLLVLKGSQNNLLEQLNTASVINKAGAESIKKSLDAISQQSSYIK